jgi:hypothetical protein
MLLTPEFLIPAVFITVGLVWLWFVYHSHPHIPWFMLLKPEGSP